MPRPTRRPGQKAADFQKASMDAVKARGGLKRVDFLERQGPQVVRVYCRKCGAPVAGPVPIGGPPLIQKGAGGVVIQQFMCQTQPLPNYVEIEIPCNDGSRHIAVVCTQCAPILDEDDLEDILIIDANEELLDLTAAGIVPDVVLERRVNRRLRKGDK